ncbi:MAG: SET domain-containing protein-lysine N-methyltransferase [bacterium]
MAAREVRPDFGGVVVRRSNVHGRGLFAARDFRKGERVLEYGGVKVPKKEGDRRTDAQWKTGRVYTFELSRRFDIDGSPRWNLARLANQSCDPSCEAENDGGWHIWIVALRHIRKGEEITYDYNFPMMDPPPRCRCGSPKCRGYMVGEEHVPALRAWLATKGLPVPPALRRPPARKTGKPRKTS